MNNKLLYLRLGGAGFVLVAGLLGPLTGCVGYVDRPSQGGVYYVPSGEPTGAVVEDDYVYYPQYEVYYSSRRHQYAYPEGGGWVSRPAPRGISPAVVLASPSVRMDFHDAPEHHHATVARQYPKNWAPSAPPQDQKENRHDEQREGNDKR